MGGKLMILRVWWGNVEEMFGITISYGDFLCEINFLVLGIFQVESPKGKLSQIGYLLFKHFFNLFGR